MTADHSSDADTATLLASGQCVLVDNSCIINAANAMRSSKPGGHDLNIYHILDLETFCRAFLFHERMTTLVGASFLRGYYSRDQATSAFYNDLLGTKALLPLSIRAGQLRYFMEDLNMLDEGARLIDVPQLRSVVGEVFGPHNPWAPSTPENTLQGELLFGKGADISDSFPVYLFPSDESPGEVADDDFWAKSSRRWEDIFLSQTYHYVAIAGIKALPYLASSVRTPLVAWLADALDRQFVDVVGASLATVGGPVATTAEAALQFFGGHSLQILEYPALLAVLLEASRSRVSLYEAIRRLRDRSDIAAYRSWCGVLARAWARQDISKVALAMSQMREAAYQVSLALNTGIFDVPLQRLPDVKAAVLPSGRGPDGAPAEAHLFKAGLSFATTISFAMSDSGTAGELLEQFTGYTLTPEDHAIAQQIFEQRKRFSSRGEPRDYWRSPVHTEVIMGDKFENISGSTIINRSVLRNSLNQIGSRDPELANALNAIAGEIEKLENAEAASSLEALSEELERAEPRKTVLRSLWDGLIAAAPTVLSLTQAVAAVAGALR